MSKNGGDVVPGNEGISIDVNLVIDRLLAAISGQALQIAKLEAMNKKLMAEQQTKEKGD